MDEKLHKQDGGKCNIKNNTYIVEMSAQNRVVKAEVEHKCYWFSSRKKLIHESLSRCIK